MDRLDEDEKGRSLIPTLGGQQEMLMASPSPMEVKTYCAKHKSLHPEEIRSPSERGYDSRWRKARKRFLAAHPLCVECMKEGRYVKATDVDHVIPFRGDMSLFWDESNWQALCHRHHSMKTRREDSNPLYRY